MDIFTIALSPFGLIIFIGVAIVSSPYIYLPVMGLILLALVWDAVWSAPRRRAARIAKKAAKRRPLIVVVRDGVRGND
jgi:hypothetical protein